MNKKFPNPIYSNREERNLYFLKLISEGFSDIETILNIGGGQKRYLKNSPFKITEIDISGDNDLILDLDKITKIPLKNKSFDAVVALDVLEHLENFHFILNEMNRLTKKYMFISLPNCFGTFFEIILNRKNKDELNEGYYHKFYGLPMQKPVDRHRWFLTIKDIERFFYKFGEINNSKIDFIYPKNNSFKSKFLGFFLNKRLKKEILTPYVWILMEKG